MLSSPPPRLLPPTAHRPPSPTMSPGGRRGRTQATTDESHLRDLSPNTTLQAFAQRPMPYDTTRDEYKIFACVDSLTPAERDLGTRVAKAAQRLKSWCDEIQQWGWSGSFAQPSEEYREKRRKSLELRIREHVKDSGVAEKLPPLEYWGSLLSVEVQAHEARLDDMCEELIALDIEELKEHVLGMHPGSKSRPSSAGYGADRRSYTPLDDFNFLITQTLLSALPHHFRLKERLSAWTARVTVLREAPRYLGDLKTAQKAMRLGWQALEPPKDESRATLDTWKANVNTISEVMRNRVGDLGRRLDYMLDSLEGREDCLPDNWIDIFEGVETDLGRWTHEFRRKMIEFEVRRNSITAHMEASEKFPPVDLAMQSEAVQSEAVRAESHSLEQLELLDQPETTPRLSIAHETDVSDHPSNAPNFFNNNTRSQEGAVPPVSPIEEVEDESIFEEGDTVIHNDLGEDPFDDNDMSLADADLPVIDVSVLEDEAPVERPQTPRLRRDSIDSTTSSIFSSSPPGTVEESPSVRNTTSLNAKPPRPALNAAMPKRRIAVIDDSSEESMPPWPPSQFAHASASSAEDLERKISDILTTIPAHIRLTSDTGVDARNRRSTRGVTNKGSKGFLRAERSLSRMKSPELTLSPVKQDSDAANGMSGRRSAASNIHNDIKLYHLTQPGKEQPLKLSIRRVGKNGERVMVRVGGGWADLGEYLRQYAEHHGRRTASNGEFELMGLEVKNTEFSPNRPESVMSKRDRRASGGVAGSSPNTTPIKSSRVGASTDEAPPPLPNFATTPAGSRETSSPSTGSSRASWQGNEVGLAGPTSKKLDLSEKKMEWVEGMMKQARTVSGTLLPQTSNQNIRAASRGSESRGESRSESRSETKSRSESRTAARKSILEARKSQLGPRSSQPELRTKQDFGDLGKVGGTKRIFMRGGGLGEH